MDSPSRPPRHASIGSSSRLNTTTSNSNGSASLTPSSTSVAGVKRPAPSLLPAFEPLSSSPALPRPLKRQNTGSTSSAARLKYPTPVPTSSTAILSSSPPAPRRARPGLARANSERAPLSAVPTAELSENGEVLIMGRSSNSSHFQLSANRLVSRVHVKARYIAASGPHEGNKIEIICNGWNGLKLHCQGDTWELFKGDSFTSETEGAEVMVDVQDARVMLKWPRKGAEASASLSDSNWDDSPRSQMRHGDGGGGVALLPSSPSRRTARMQSPISPSPAGHLLGSDILHSLLPEDLDGGSGIQIYEDEPELPVSKQEHIIDVGVSMRTEATASFTSEVDDQEEHNPNEENDPIVHSFGPFGGNLSGRLASMLGKSPKATRPAPRRQGLTTSPNASRTLSHMTVFGSPLKKDFAFGSPIKSNPLFGSPVKKMTVKRETTPSDASLSPIPEAEYLSPGKLAEASPSPPPPATTASLSPPPPPTPIDPSVTNHVINQLAFSRLSSTPLSTIMQNLPADAKPDVTLDALRAAVEASPCIGLIARQGKDAAGKALESEYYYVAEQDGDEHRRGMVVGELRKPSLRNCRKQHKQYYWKRPRTP